MDRIQEDYVSAGFFLTRKFQRPTQEGLPFFNPKLLPEYLVSASRCIAPCLPDYWTYTWAARDPKKRKEKLLAMGLTEDALEPLSEWVSSRLDAHIAWPTPILDIDTAEELAQAFFPLENMPLIIELALHRSLLREFRAEAPPTASHPGRQKTYGAIERHRPPHSRGQRLGFEPLDLEDDGISHSWLCNALETEIHQELDIRPNANGLIETFEEALRCVEYIDRPESGAEPGLWLPWLLLDVGSTIEKDN